MSDDVLLSVSDLHTWYEIRRFGFARVGHVRAVDGVSFQLKRGEAVAVVGESGCGKSTLVKTILGLVPVTQGSIFFEGKDLSTLSKLERKAYRAEVGYVQQDPFGALPPFMSIRQILEEPLIIHGIKHEDERHRRIVKALEDVKLTPVNEILNKFPHMLSGGQQQRVVIARAIILDPKLIVADEPVSMLDASVRVEILRLMQNLQHERNLSIIYITHDLATVRYFSQRIFVMYGAKLIEQADANELVNDPKHPYTQALLSAIADPDANNAKILRDVPSGEPPSLLNPPAGCRFHPRCPQIISGLCNMDPSPPEYYPKPGSSHKTACWLYQDAAQEPTGVERKEDAI